MCLYCNIFILNNDTINFPIESKAMMLPQVMFRQQQNTAELRKGYESQFSQSADFER